jgi:phenylpyruvate tautomerase PptA (4-oxalocrotonate tautomerase family)
MDINDRSNKHREFPDSTNGLSRRNVLMTATIGAGALAAAPSVMADAGPAGNFGAPLVEVHVPAGVLTPEQKGAMIKGITDVVLGATKQPPDPARRLFVQIFETAKGGFGVNGQVFVPRSK